MTFLICAASPDYDASWTEKLDEKQRKKLGEARQLWHDEIFELLPHNIGKKLKEQEEKAQSYEQNITLAPYFFDVLDKDDDSETKMDAVALGRVGTMFQMMMPSWGDTTNTFYLAMSIFFVTLSSIVSGLWSLLVKETSDAISTVFQTCPTLPMWNVDGSLDDGSVAGIVDSRVCTLPFAGWSEVDNITAWQVSNSLDTTVQASGKAVSCHLPSLAAI